MFLFIFQTEEVFDIGNSLIQFSNKSGNCKYKMVQFFNTYWCLNILIHQICTMTFTYSFLVLLMCYFFLFHFSNYVLAINEGFKSTDSRSVFQGKHIFSFYSLLTAIAIFLKNHYLQYNYDILQIPN